MLPLIAALFIYMETASGDINQMATQFTSEFQRIMAMRAGNIDVILSWLNTFVMIAIPITVVLALVFAPEPKKEEVEGERFSILKGLLVVRRNGPYLGSFSPTSLRLLESRWLQLARTFLLSMS